MVFLALTFSKELNIENPAFETSINIIYSTKMIFNYNTPHSDVIFEN